MSSNLIRCLDLTFVSFIMCINSILSLPTWIIVVNLLCLLLALLPDDIEIWI